LAACVPPGGPGPGPGPTPTPGPGAAADLSQELTGGNGPFIGTAIAVDLQQAGYVQHEYAGAGTATAYRANGSLSGDGRWNLAADGTAPYRTRVLVRKPADDARFIGKVVVEWLNVSGGVDAQVDWAFMREGLMRAGYAWVGVSAQLVGVNGAGGAFPGLKNWDPTRYGSLNHPGDQYSYDIFSQAAQALRT
nr:alpha/beta hydrolase domain-containing protein [Micromonospora sp. DSM 115978]